MCRARNVDSELSKIIVVFVTIIGVVIFVVGLSNRLLAAGVVTSSRSSN